MKKEMINVSENNCYGCTACFNICPKKAIKMVENNDGFLYPKIDFEKCIGCGLCKKVCPYSNKKSNNYEQELFVAQSQDLDNLSNSSSGGLFLELANHIIAKNGFVCGCIMCEDFSVKHILTNDINEVKRMQGSKYVQSDMSNIYSLIKEKLVKNHYILFTGTPCQVHGLNTFLGNEYNNLFTIDLICHGVPSQKVFNEYIKYTCKNKGLVKSFKFRDKMVNGWMEMGSIKTEKNTVIKTSANNDSYYYLFLNNYINRMTCYDCKYKSDKRYSDITLGDAWMLKYKLKNMDPELGISLVLINTQKGKNLFSKINSNLIIENILEKDNIIKKLNNIQEVPNIRNGIFNSIFNEGYDVVEKKVCKYRKVIPFIKSLIPYRMKKIINNIRRGKNEN